MFRITLNLRRPPILHGNQHPASIGAIVRTHGMNDLLHPLDYTVPSKPTRASTRKQKAGQLTLPGSKQTARNYSGGGRTRTRPATTKGTPVLWFLNTNPRETRFGVPAAARPGNPSMFSNTVKFPVSTVNGPFAA